MGVALYTYNMDFIENTDNQEYWYIAGLLAADGYISDECIELSLWENDIDIIKKIRDIICPDKPIYTKKQSGAKVLKLNNRIMSAHFKDLFGMTSNQKHTEMTFPDVPSHYLNDFIRGYFDGDGTVDTTKAYQIVSGEKRIYQGVRVRILGNYDFLSKLNQSIKEFVPNKTKAISKKGKENVFVVTYNFSTAQGIIEWFYKDSPSLYMKRKRNKATQIFSDLKI